jgi:hypothetical protein
MTCPRKPSTRWCFWHPSPASPRASTFLFPDRGQLGIERKYQEKMIEPAGRKNTSHPLARTSHASSPPRAANLFRVIHALGIDTATPDGLARTLPFSPADTTAGAENEYQTAVVGDRRQVDLALEIEEYGSLSLGQHLAGNLLLSPGSHGRAIRNGTGSRPGEGPALSALSVVDPVRQPAVRPDRKRPAGGAILCAAPAGAPEKTQQPDIGQLLPRLVHEPLFVGMERR